MVLITFCHGWVVLNACRKQPSVMYLEFLLFFFSLGDFIEIIFVLTAVPYLKLLNAGCSQCRHAFNPSAIYVKFVIRVALGKVSFKTLRYQHCIFISHRP